MEKLSNSGFKNQFPDKGLVPDDDPIPQSLINGTTITLKNGRHAGLDPDKYQSLCNTMSEGFCIIEIISKNEHPADILCIETNPAFEKQVGLRDISGKYLSKVLPEETSFWVDKLADVVISGKTAEFIEYSGSLNKWLEVSAFRFGNTGENLVAVLVTDVTERRQAEEKLRQSSERYQALIETNCDFIWELDSSGRYLYCSPQMKDLWGLEPEKMIGKPFFGNQQEDLKSENSRILRNVLNSGQQFQNIESTFRAQGNTYHVEISGVPYFNVYGELLGFRGTTRDVTARKKAEEVIRVSELKYRRIVETADEGVCQIDKELMICYVNNKILEISGYDYDDLLGRPIMQFISPEERHKLKKLFTGISDEIRKNFSIRLFRKDGTEISLAINTTAILTESGNLEGYVGMVTDITERIAIEKDLKRTKRKLENALNIGKIGTWELNLKTGDMVLDRRSEEIFSVKHRTFGGTLHDFEKCIHPEDLHHFREDAERAKVRGQFESICRTRPKNCKSNYILSKAIVARDKKNAPLSMAGISFDITEMKEDTEKTLIRLNEDLLRSNNDLQQFAYVASHDLQEPLRMVSSFTQLLQMRYAGKLDEDAREYINFAVNGSKRMYELINGLLAYSRIETRGKEFHSVNLVNVVEKVKANMKLLMEESGATIISNELPVIIAEENQMIQLFQNLIENGLKFRKGKPVITITSALRNEMHIISVKDNGIGIENQYFEKIFRIFQRLHHSEYKGTGIGLAICQRIVERHGGRIWVVSKPGEGSTFSFSVPAL